VACLFFFWPPVHWVSRKLQEARELACDERAIERGAFSAPEYASHLLEVVAATCGRADHHALAIGRSALRLERRIDRLLEVELPRSLGWRHGAVLLVLLFAALIGFRPAVPAAPLPVFGACGGRGASLQPPAADSCSGDDCALQCQP
jgi:beta-lactamase regulating signal transducer with metallopeptidase domain